MRFPYSPGRMSARRGKEIGARLLSARFLVSSWRTQDATRSGLCEDIKPAVGRISTTLHGRDTARTRPSFRSEGVKGTFPPPAVPRREP